MTDTPNPSSQASKRTVAFGLAAIAVYIAIAVGVTLLANAGLWPFSRDHAAIIAGILVFGAACGLIALPVAFLLRRTAPWLWVASAHTPDMLDKAQPYIAAATFAIFIGPAVASVAFNVDFDLNIAKGPANWILLAVGILGFGYYAFLSGRGVWRRWKARIGTAQ